MRRARPWLCTPCSSVSMPSGAMASSRPQLQPPKSGLGLWLLAQGSADLALCAAWDGSWGCEVLAVGTGWVLLAWLAGDGALCTELCRAASCHEVRWEQGRGLVSVTVGPAPRSRGVLGALAAGVSPPGSRVLSAPQTSILPFPSQGPLRMQAWEPRWGMRSVCFHGDGHDIR